MNARKRRELQEIEWRKKMKGSLLKNARKFVGRKRLEYRYTDEHFELAIAWLKGEISSGQVAYALGKNQAGSVNYRTAVALREAYRLGKIKVVFRPTPKSK